MLEGLGFQVEAVADGRDAVKRIRDGKRYRLIVLDLTMREVGGAEALAAIRRMASAIPVILISGFATEEVEERGVVEDARLNILQKPFRLSELTDAVSMVLSPVR